MIAGTKGDVISTIPRVNGFKAAINDVGVTVTIQMSTYGYYGLQRGIERVVQVWTIQHLQPYSVQVM
ncbi:uncharacterized protein with GYD domain [Peribacillus sp. B2I2]|uniref:hypothetical protein n=1 Tax=Peribacillus sp. B2I2 TaxID=3156468 RepID=UPI0035176E4C